MCSPCLPEAFPRWGRSRRRRGWSFPRTSRSSARSRRRSRRGSAGPPRTGRRPAGLPGRHPREPHGKLIVSGVEAGSPAARAGVRVGDVLAKAGDKPVPDATMLAETVRRQGTGRFAAAGAVPSRQDDRRRRHAGRRQPAADAGPAGRPRRSDRRGRGGGPPAKRRPRLRRRSGEAEGRRRPDLAGRRKNQRRPGAGRPDGPAARRLRPTDGQARRQHLRGEGRPAGRRDAQPGPSRLGRPPAGPVSQAGLSPRRHRHRISRRQAQPQDHAEDWEDSLFSNGTYTKTKRHRPERLRQHERLLPGALLRQASRSRARSSTGRGEQEAGGVRHRQTGRRC